MFSERNFTLGGFKFRWIALVSTLLAFFLFVAFNESPQAETQPGVIKTIHQELALPPASTAMSTQEEFWQIEQVRQDDTLGTIFSRLNIRDDEAFKFLMLSPDARALNTLLLPGHTIEVKTDINGKLLHLEYDLDNENILVAGLTDQGFLVATQKLILQKQEIVKSAVIRDSLFGATDDADIPDQIAIQIADILSSDIDFYQDLRAGDHFNVVYEAYYNAGNLAKTGNVLAVEFVNNGKTYQAIRFGNNDGKYAYYTPDGKSLHKSFLRSPLEYTRISSSFSTGRYHPILNRIRAHKGVDMAAPIGTRIKASGDGVVEFMGKKGGYGNVIVLKHPGGIKTVYGHLSRFSSSLRRGDQVSQGDIIGYVGMTGLATGPHLHYEFLLNGVHRDPMKVALPTSVPLEGKYLSEFREISIERMAQIEMVKRYTKLVSADQ
jgi:murein DD-endopeptidase MepM/ murein hydrolase activator NlpD